MSLLFACLMPLVMLGLVFFLARIEDRHLTPRPAAADATPAEPDGQAFS